MKIKKLKKILNENNPFDIDESDDGIIVKVTFSGEYKFSLDEIKETEYYFNNYGNNDYDYQFEIENNIHYSIEQLIQDKGITPYEYELYDKEGNIIDIEYYLKQKNYNL
jgi:hypothetical protein